MKLQPLDLVQLSVDALYSTSNQKRAELSSGESGRLDVKTRQHLHAVQAVAAPAGMEAFDQQWPVAMRAQRIALAAGIGGVIGVHVADGTFAPEPSPLGRNLPHIWLLERVRRLPERLQHMLGLCQ
ncbi:MAG: hypothetical protein QOI17_1130, partial [Gaiellales bacterium]|nr:hypothetical protein [Gaiellales bacterium]